MVAGMARQTMPSSKTHEILGPFQPPPFDLVPLDDEQHDKLLGTEHNVIGNGYPL